MLLNMSMVNPFYCSLENSKREREGGREEQLVLLSIEWFAITAREGVSRAVAHPSKGNEHFTTSELDMRAYDVLKVRRL